MHALAQRADRDEKAWGKGANFAQHAHFDMCTSRFALSLT